MRLTHVLSGACFLLLMAQPAFAQDLQPPPPMNPSPAPAPAPMPPPPGPSVSPSPSAAPSPGLSAPPSGAVTAAPSSPPPGSEEEATTKKLDEAEEKDSGRKFELFWLNADLGGSYIDMAQFSSSTLKIEKTSAGGPAFSAGAGVRLLIFSIGGRLRYNALNAFNMWQVNGEIGVKLPISSIDILFGVHGGYSFVGRLGDAGVATDPNTPKPTDAVQVRGFNGGLDLGIDYFVSPTFSVGVGALGDFLLLNRPAAALPANVALLPVEQQNAIKNDPLYQKSGTSAGLQLGAALRLGLHFGL